MRKHLLASAASALMVLFAGCGQHAADSPVSLPGAFNAVQYCQDFAPASPELKSLAQQAWMATQSGAFSNALKYLDKLSGNPALNDAQRKSVADLTAQVRRHVAESATTR